MRSPLRTRPARPTDRVAIEALLAPEVAAGTVLPRTVDPADFLVAELDGHGIVGVVGMASWTADVVELGSLVSSLRGRGVGQLLVDAVLRHAVEAGAESVVALTGLQAWFTRRGFVAHTVQPWALARRQPVLLSADRPRVDAAAAAKARTSCALCPHLASCAQHLMVRPVKKADRKVA